MLFIHNATLPDGLKLRHFVSLHKEFDADDDEITRTRKIRRRFVAEKYAVLIDALYTGQQHQFIETQVKFEDGRTGSISASCARTMTISADRSSLPASFTTSLRSVGCRSACSKRRLALWQGHSPRLRWTILRITAS